MRAQAVSIIVRKMVLMRALKLEAQGGRVEPNNITYHKAKRLILYGAKPHISNLSEYYGDSINAT